MRPNSLVIKVANYLQQQQQVDPQAQQDPSALGTIGAEIGGGQGQMSSSGPKVNKDQLYERIIQEKDKLARLQMQLAASGQMPQEELQQPSMAQVAPLEQQMQASMSQELQQGQASQPIQQDPYSGLQPQASLKKKLRDALEKKSIAPLAIPAAALTAYNAYETLNALRYYGGKAARAGLRGAESIRSGHARSRIAANPLVARDILEQEYRKTPKLVDSRGLGSKGELNSSRNLFGGGPSGGMPQEFVNKYAPKPPQQNYTSAGQ